MPAPRIHSPYWGACARAVRCDDIRVSRDEWLRASHDTDDWLLSLRHGPSSAPPAVSLSPTPAPSMGAADADVERPLRTVRPAPTPPVDGASGGMRARRESASKERAQLRAEGWTFADEAGAPNAKRKVTRYLPPDARFVGWIEARGGTASLSAISRRFNLTAAERDILLGRYCGAGDGIISHRLNGRGGGQQFTLLRKPRQLPPPPL